MFDISVTGTSSINITGFAQNFSGTSATISGFELWTIAGGITGNTANASAWTLISSTGSFTSNTQGTPTNIPFSTSISISLNPGQTIGIYLTNQSGRTLNSYTDGTAVGNVAATNSNLTIYEGYGVAYPFGQLFSPRIWNGTIFYSAGPAAADTQSSMQYQSRQLRSAFNTQTVAANFALNYDCNVFDVKGMCISAGGRYTTIDNPNINNSAAVVTLGYKVNPNIRIGAYLDQNINISNPTGINISNNTPLMGLYAVWNKEQSGLGYQVRLANTYQDKDVTQTRTVFNTSEAGSGKSSLQSQSYLAELSYAFQYEDRTLVRPYFGLRYTHLKQKGYTEDTTDTVTDPLTVAALRDKGTTALLGLKINRSLTDKATLTAQLGFEQDLHHKVDQYSATDLNGSELTAIAFNSNIKRTRPVASIGAFYDVTKTQRASATINYQQTPFHSTGSTTAYFNYMIGF
ncbi:autotransporter outer membrane beta-barrel domain-containing protein [Candidatus Methylopumilus planktonicus]|uniref:autotransporter outer membrane beta-barrel domain-containing protein n=1 Tax=Candidatus Methylopumilus planktonicus TaxID=1581557 RepID=UPI003BEEBD2B